MVTGRMTYPTRFGKQNNFDKFRHVSLELIIEPLLVQHDDHINWNHNATQYYATCNNTQLITLQNTQGYAKHMITQQTQLHNTQIYATKHYTTYNIMQHTTIIHHYIFKHFWSIVLCYFSKWQVLSTVGVSGEWMSCILSTRSCVWAERKGSIYLM